MRKSLYEDYDNEYEYSDRDICGIITDALYYEDGVKEIADFRDVGMLTMDDGIVIYMENGQRFTVRVSEW